MKFHCSSCNIFVAEIKEGSRIKKGAVMICSNCLERFKIADQMAKMAREQSKSIDMPEPFKEIFGKKFT